MCVSNPQNATGNEPIPLHRVGEDDPTSVVIGRVAPPKVDRTEVSTGNTTTLRRYLEEHPESSVLLEHVRATIQRLGPMTEKMTKSQVRFQANKPFAWVWAPGQYLGRGAPLVLSVVLPDRDDSHRWKEIVEPSPGRFTHHLELHSVTDVDREVVSWLAEARRAAS